METTSRLGLSEDIMNSVQTMPGVVYSGQWSAEPSVRGGYPREMKISLDGVYLIHPWHWGNSYSIFNPNFVESAKLNNGVFSAKYGQAVSGLLEVTSVEPKEFHWGVNLSFLSTEMYLQTPIVDPEKAGILLFGKCTYMETLIGAFRLVDSSGITDPIKTAPYIHDFYAKAYYKPADKLTLIFNGLFGSDGMGTSQNKEDEDSGVTNDMSFDYDMFMAFCGISAKWLPTEKLQVKFDLSYNWIFEDLNAKNHQTGFIKYSDDFMTEYGSLLSDEQRVAGGFNVCQDEMMKEKIIEHILQGKAVTDIEIAEGHTLSFGLEEIYSYVDSDLCMDVFKEFGTVPNLSFGREISKTVSCKKNLSSAAFAAWSFGTDKSLWNGEVGLRLDHMYIFNSGNISLNSVPNLDPRVSVSITPWRGTDYFDRITFSTGAGFFSGIPENTIFIEKDSGLGFDDIKQNRAVLGVIGAEAKMYNGWGFKAETYFKYYLNRMYTIIDQSDPLNTVSKFHCDGKGYSVGFDTMIQKNGDGWFDGYLSYSFVYAKYKNPTAPAAGNSNQRMIDDDPLDQWYFPQFHRFHSMNLVMNFHPAKNWTITVKGVLATGLPRTDGERFCYPVRQSDGSIRQRYTRSWLYSDTLRTDISCPIDIRISQKGTFRKNSKLNWEWYIGAEDIFTNLYAPKKSQTFDQNTGKDTDENKADFSLGIPMFNFGYKLSY